jgi:hypothetical protein
MWQPNTYRSTATTQRCHNSKCVIFQEKLLKVLKCYNFLWVQRRHNCSPAASVANCVMTLYPLKVHLQTFISLPVTQKCQMLSCDTLVANERYVEQTTWLPRERERETDRTIIFRLSGALYKVINKNTLCVDCPLMKTCSCFYHEYEKASSLEFAWPCINPILEFAWPCINQILEFAWPCINQILEFAWPCINPIMKTEFFKPAVEISSVIYEIKR